MIKMYEKKFHLLLISTAYVLAWLIPIEGTGGMQGYEAAMLANHMLIDGISYFLGLGGNTITFNYVNVIENLVNIIAGLPNVLFITAFTVFVAGRREALYFSAPCILIMLLWGSDTSPLGGYGLWLLSGAGLFLLSFFKFRNTKGISTAKMMLSGPFILSYCLALLVFANEWLDRGL